MLKEGSALNAMDRPPSYYHDYYYHYYYYYYYNYNDNKHNIHNDNDIIVIYLIAWVPACFVFKLVVTFRLQQGLASYASSLA